jgi:hypothetical protein
MCSEENAMSFKRFIQKQELDEAAILDTSDLCIYFSKGEGLVGLYKNTEEFQRGMEENLGEEIAKSIIGGTEYKINDDEDCVEIDTMRAEKGYGPLLYIILMIGSRGKGLCPTTKSEYISDEAKVVWKKFYDGPGSKLVKKERLSEDYHKEEYLNYKYDYVGDKKIDIKRGIENSKKAIGEDPYDEKDTLIIEAIDKYIKDKMHELYPH